MEIRSWGSCRSFLCLYELSAEFRKVYTTSKGVIQECVQRSRGLGQTEKERQRTIVKICCLTIVNDDSNDSDDNDNTT